MDTIFSLKSFFKCLLPALPALPALAVLLVLAGCRATDTEAEAAPPAPLVTVLELKPAAVTLYDDLPGRVAAFRTAEIRPQVGGIVLRRLFQQGAEVKAGQPLFQLNPAPLKAEFDTAAASLQHAQATLARTRRQAERLQPLIEADAISRQAYDDAVSERDLAAASVAQARAALERRRLDLAFATVQAPISGRIGQELVSEGALVSQGDSAPMARIQQTDKVYVDVRQPAPMLASIHALGKREAGSVPVTILDAGGKPYAAKASILFSDINVDAGTGDATIRILVDNSERMLLPGMFVRARIVRSASSNELMAPQQAIQRSADGQAVAWTLNKANKVTQRKVEVGPVIGHQYVVREGLKHGDLLVVEGQERLQDGAQVTPKLWKAALAQAASHSPSHAENTPAQSATPGTSLTTTQSTTQTTR